MVVGCQTSTTIAWKTPEKRAGTQRDVVATELGGYYRKKPRKVGRHTITVFAIPTIPIHAKGPVKDAFNKAVASALSSANYDVEFEDGPPSGESWLKGDVTKFSYWSYMWFWPIMFEGGTIRYELVLNDENGDAVWSKKFKAGSFWVTIGGAYGYNKKIRKAMTRLLRDIEEATSSDEFQAALNK